MHIYGNLSQRNNNSDLCDVFPAHIHIKISQLSDSQSPKPVKFTIDKYNKNFVMCEFLTILKSHSLNSKSILRFTIQISHFQASLRSDPGKFTIDIPNENNRSHI